MYGTDLISISTDHPKMLLMSAPSTTLEFFFFTNNPVLANVANQFPCIDSVFIDLESLGKSKRQANTNSFLSTHLPSDISVIRSVLTSAILGVRINPINPSTPSEVDHAIDSGADVLMLPMFRDPEEVDILKSYVRNRCKIDLLFETPSAIQSISSFHLQDIRKIHFGINDLSIAFSQPHMFSMYFHPLLRNAAHYLRSQSLSFGIGGIGAIDSQPYAPPLILAASRILSSTRLILSRSFLDSLDYTDKGSLVSSFDFQLKQILTCYDLQASLTISELTRIESDFRQKLAS